MAHDDDLKELYTLARRALECQAELGHKEIIFEVRSRSRASVPDVSRGIGDMPLRPDVRSASAAAPPTEEAAPAKKKSPQPLPDYGPIPAPKEQPSLLDVGEDTGPESTSLDEHRQAICDCTKCSLGHSRTNFVYGTGNPRAKIMFIGEAPGRDEDLQGEPFVGRAGKLLNDILKAMKLTRQDVYIGNILKCRPPENRDPAPDEMRECMPYLKEQIRLIQPQFICALGRISAQGLLDTTTPLGKLRCQWHRYEGIPMLVTYHPAALLRFQQYKRPTWEDMQVLMQEYEKLNGKITG